MSTFIIAPERNNLEAFEVEARHINHAAAYGAQVFLERRQTRFRIRTPNGRWRMYDTYGKRRRDEETT